MIKLQYLFQTKLQILREMRIFFSYKLHIDFRQTLR